MTELVQFHQKGGIWFALLGVHVVALAGDGGEWMSCLDSAGWRRRADLDGAKAAISDHVRQWYEAAHQKLAPGQAEQLCKLPRQAPIKEVVKINAFDVEAVTLRLKRDGVVTTYVMPAVVDGVEPPSATLAQARMYCISACETAGHKCRAQPADALCGHELAVFGGLVRLIDACTSSDVIKDELRRIAKDRATESTRVAIKTDQAEGLPA